MNAEAAPHVLIVGRHGPVAATVAQGFADAGFIVDVPSVGYGYGDARTEAAHADPLADAGRKLILFNLGLLTSPDISAIALLREAGVTSPILVLADRGECAVAALNAGADDFVTGPIDTSELLARARALVRRCRPAPPLTAFMGLGDLRIDPATATAYVGGRPLTLGDKQFALLAILARRPGQIMSRSALRDQLYFRADLPTSSVIDVFIHGIRQQLAARQSVAAVVCVRGVGFCLVARADSS